MTFIYNKRLGIHIPAWTKNWEDYKEVEQRKMIDDWEVIRGKIPDRIKEIENLINCKQSQLEEEENFQKSCSLNSEISLLASTINDLWIWFRTDPQISFSKD